MINNTEFIKRLQEVIHYYGESASSFAEKVGVQRSSISHILSGRNKPSLDFVLKVLSSYPEVDLYWLMNGKGHFPKKVKMEDLSLYSESKIQSVPHTINSPVVSESNDKTIERIVIFYKDGTFKNFEQS